MKNYILLALIITLSSFQLYSYITKTTPQTSAKSPVTSYTAKIFDETASGDKIYKNNEYNFQIIFPYKFTFLMPSMGNANIGILHIMNEKAEDKDIEALIIMLTLPFSELNFKSHQIKSLAKLSTSEKSELLRKLVSKAETSFKENNFKLLDNKYLQVEDKEYAIVEFTYQESNTLKFNCQAYTFANDKLYLFWLHSDFDKKDLYYNSFVDMLKTFKTLS